MPTPYQFRIVAALTQDHGRPTDTQTLEMLVLLTPDARLAPANAAGHPFVRRLQNGSVIWSGHLVMADEGWALRTTNGEDTPLWYLTTQRLRPGEHLTLHAPDGHDLVFRVVNVTGMNA
jgi:hypothetical protein